MNNMSELNYVVVYYVNGQTSVHSYACWEKLRDDFRDKTERLVEILSPYAACSLVWRNAIESIHLCTEDEADWNSRRHQAFKKLDKTNSEEWE